MMIEIILDNNATTQVSPILHYIAPKGRLIKQVKSIRNNNGVDFDKGTIITTNNDLYYRFKNDKGKWSPFNKINIDNTDTINVLESIIGFQYYVPQDISKINLLENQCNAIVKLDDVDVYKEKLPSEVILLMINTYLALLNDKLIMNRLWLVKVMYYSNKLKDNEYSNLVNIINTKFLEQSSTNFIGRSLIDVRDKAIIFKFRNECNWEYHFIRNRGYLFPLNNSKGNYAYLSLSQSTKAGGSYYLKLSLSIKTSSDAITFWLLNTDNKQIQCINRKELNYGLVSENEQRVCTQFRANGKYNSFMIGSSQLTGSNSYICFNRIFIAEVDHII